MDGIYGHHLDQCHFEPLLSASLCCPFSLFFSSCACVLLLYTTPFGCADNLFAVIMGLNYDGFSWQLLNESLFTKILQNTCSHDPCTYKRTPFLLHHSVHCFWACFWESMQLPWDCVSATQAQRKSRLETFVEQRWKLWHMLTWFSPIYLPGASCFWPDGDSNNGQGIGWLWHPLFPLNHLEHDFGPLTPNCLACARFCNFW